MQRAVDRGQIAAAVHEGVGDALHGRVRRLVGDEMARELGGDVLRGDALVCEIAQHRFALAEAVVGVAPAEH